MSSLTSLYIPKKINVGYNRREDCYTKKLGYIIYWDDKGILRKEKSWSSWRDHKIPNQEFENKPTSGFVFNKGVTRYMTNRSLLRVYDPRDFEFEISISNLIFILTEVDCYKGKGLDGEFVYAWDGTELVLLPAGSQEYAASFKNMSFQKQKIVTKDLVPGAVYQSKEYKDYVYLGKHDYYNRDDYDWAKNPITMDLTKEGDDRFPANAKKEKRFIFFQINTDDPANRNGNFYYNPVNNPQDYRFMCLQKVPPTLFKAKIADDCSEYAPALSAYQAETIANPVVSVEFEPIKSMASPEVVLTREKAKADANYEKTKYSWHQWTGIVKYESVPLYQKYKDGFILKFMHFHFTDQDLVCFENRSEYYYHPVIRGKIHPLSHKKYFIEKSRYGNDEEIIFMNGSVQRLKDKDPYSTVRSGYTISKPSNSSVHHADTDVAMDYEKIVQKDPFFLTMEQIVSEGFGLIKINLANGMSFVPHHYYHSASYQILFPDNFIDSRGLSHTDEDEYEDDDD